MDTYGILENSFIMINKNFDFYKKSYAHYYYSDVDDTETSFIDRLFKSTSVELKPQDKMLNFSISTIFTAMAILVEILKRSKVLYSCEDLESICVGYTSLDFERYDLSKRTFDELMEDLFSLLTDGIDLESRKKSGSERTPNDIISYMLDLIGYQGKGILGKTITDPACGTGTFIAQITNRIIDATSENERIGLGDMLINHKSIIAYDTKPSNVFVTKIVIVALLLYRHCVSNIKDVVRLIYYLPVYCSNYLTIHDKTDYIVGNPPYIRLQNLSNENRQYIKNNYSSATGRFDIYTCFLENGDKNLKPFGRMCLITSNKFFTTNYGVGIRQYLANSGHLKKIVDLYDTKFFGAAVLPAITVCENSKLCGCLVEYIGIKNSQKEATRICKNANELFKYIETEMDSNKGFVKFGEAGSRVFEISKSEVRIPENGTTWNYSSRDENDLKDYMDSKAACRLSDLMEICVGIKTTADPVFVKPMTVDFVKKNAFESNVIYPLIQSFDVNRWKITWGDSKRDRYILYPHRELSGNMEAIPLEEIPHVAAYLERCADVLKKRTYLMESKTRVWYECWVPQKLSKFKQAKIVTRDIVSHNSFAYDAEGRLCQGNTFFLIRKTNSLFNIGFLNLAEEDYFLFLLGLLNSHAMEYYQKMISGCLYSQKYRYTSSNLNRWPIPEFNIQAAHRIADIVRRLMKDDAVPQMLETEINDIVNDQFGFSRSDINQIEEFINICI